MPRPASVPRPVLVLALVLAVAAAMLGAQGARAASVTVSSTPQGAAIPAGFLGISTETHDLFNYAGSNPGAVDQAFVNLLGDIAPGQRPVLRLGGDSTDWSWVPVSGRPKPHGVTFTITPRWLAVAHALAQAVNGKLILGVNLEANQLTDAIEEARAFQSKIGRNDIDAIEIGNEPELYHHFAWFHTSSGAAVMGRPNSYSEADYFAQFGSWAHRLPRVPIAGPVFGIGNWLDDLGGFLRAERFVSLVTMHAYPLFHCTPSHVVTIPELLASSSSTGFVREVAPFVATSRAAGKPMRIDEVNAISCGGTKGVSNSFASALWMANTLFGLADTGVGGVNVHMVPGSINSILNPTGGGNSPSIAVQPEYYAMMLFAQAAPPGSRILRLHAALPAGVQAWATRDASGTVRLMLINEHASGATPVTVRVPAAAGPAIVESLHAHGLASTSGVSLGGQSFGAATGTGMLAGTAQRPLLAPLHGTYTVSLPAASAQLLTFSPPPGAALRTVLGTPELLQTLMPSW